MVRVPNLLFKPLRSFPFFIAVVLQEKWDKAVIVESSFNVKKLGPDRDSLRFEAITRSSL